MHGQNHIKCAIVIFTYSFVTSRKRKFGMRIGYNFSYKLFTKIGSKPADTNYFYRIKI